MAAAAVLVAVGDRAHAARGADPAAGAIIVHTAGGFLMGEVTPDGVAFKGIPYAQPPVGEWRWRLPQPHSAWTGTRDAQQFGAICPQPATAADAPAQSEDCLFLNVYTPRAASAARRPVMVWIHGGTNTTGAGSFYDPTPLVDAGDVIVVTLNYRLGAMGFLAHPALQAESGTTGNYGLADQQQALRWLHTNIAAFGGDPANITLFGESSGGMNVISHLVSPRSAGLFAKAIVESGTFLLETSGLARSEAQGRAFANHVGCSSQSAACLRGQPVADVLANQGNPEGGPGSGVVAYELATVDGLILPAAQQAALASGRFRRVPVLLGNNAIEGKLFVPPALSAAQYGARLTGDAREAHRPVPGALLAYPLATYATPADGAGAAFGDSVFACTDRAVERLLGLHVATYAYEFDDPAGTAPLGSTHGMELKYLFDVSSLGAPFDGGPATLPAPSRALALTMRQYWTGFARFGDPQSPNLQQPGDPQQAGLPPWPLASAGAIQRLVAPAPSAEPVQRFEESHECGYWNGGRIGLRRGAIGNIMR